MPDPQLPLDLPPQGDTPDDAAPSPEPAADQPFGDLSEAAREAVRHPADPRLDRHLAHLGLSDESPAPRARLNAPRRDVGAELDELRGTVEALQAVADGLRAGVDAQRDAAAAVAGRLRLVLAALLVVAVVAVAAVLLALR